MLTLRELQHEFRRALLDGPNGATVGTLEHGGPRHGPPYPPALGAPRQSRGALRDSDRLLSEVLGDGLTPDLRLGIYRHHVLTTLTAVLRDTYPVVGRLVGPGFFGYAADGFIRRDPPSGPCLFEYGAGFADFLAEFPPCRDLPYLPDVARLEWAMHRALHAEDVEALDPQALRRIPAEQTAALRLALDPSVTLLASSWPADRIWRANQPEADPEATVDLGAGGVWLEVRRLGDDVVFRPLAPAAHAFRAALAAGRNLEAAAEAAFAIDAGFDLARALHALLGEGLVVGVER